MISRPVLLGESFTVALRFLRCGFGTGQCLPNQGCTHFTDTLLQLRLPARRRKRGTTRLGPPSQSSAGRMILLRDRSTEMADVGQSVKCFEGISPPSTQTRQRNRVGAGPTDDLGRRTRGTARRTARRDVGGRSTSCSPDSPNIPEAPPSFGSRSASLKRFSVNPLRSFCRDHRRNRRAAFRQTVGVSMAASM